MSIEHKPIACNQCEGIVCADSGENQRVMGESGGDRWITFPESVEDCPRRNVLGIDMEELPTTPLPMAEPEKPSWYVPVGRPDLMMPVK